MSDTNGVSSPNSAKDLEIVEVADEYKELEDEDDDVEEEATYEEEIEDTSDDKGNVEETASDEKEDDDDIGDRASDSNSKEAPENENEKSDSEKDIDDSRADIAKEVDKKDLKSDTSSTENRDIRSRVFIGHLNTEKCTRRDLEKLFKPCGKVVAISVLNGYGFIQFDNEESARKAIDDIHGTPFFDMKLVVDKPSAWKKLDGESTKDTKPWPKDPKRPFIPDRRGSGRRDRDSRGSRDNYHDKRGRRDRDQRRRYDHEDYYVSSRYRDLYYDRYLEMRYMEERMAAERYYDRYNYDRYSALGMGTARSRYGDDMSLSGRGYDYYGSTYDRPRDDDYDRDRRPFDSYGFR